MYCEKCLMISDAQKCPCCGTSNLRKPQPDDYCFLIEKEYFWSEMLADVFEQNKIFFYKKPKLGAGMAVRVGMALESYKFYVSYSCLEMARELVEQLFHEGKDIS